MILLCHCTSALAIEMQKANVGTGFTLLSKALVLFWFDFDFKGTGSTLLLKALVLQMLEMR